MPKTKPSYEQKKSISKKLLGKLLSTGVLSSPKTGTLETYFETGMECMGLILYEDGIIGGPNPNFDPSKPEGGSNFKNYKTHDGINFVEKMDVIELLNKNGKVYKRILCIYDIKKAREDGYRLSLYIEGWDKMELARLFYPENKKARLYKFQRRVSDGQKEKV